MKETRAFEVFAACANAIMQGVLINWMSRTDKEFHFQNWFEDRLRSAGLLFDRSGRNSYPDFTLVEFTEGYEAKGLAWPGRESTYNCNSQIPTGYHNGRDIFYVFGRYPKAEEAGNEYPVIDLVICHGDFLNADHEYIHKNRSVKGFGSYGDIMIRDRKMYVAPTPFAVAQGLTGTRTLLVPASWESPHGFKTVGNVIRVEAAQLVVGYEFDLMGSGVTVGEAVKLGCRVVGRDINPVAYVACRAAFSRYAHADVLRTYRSLEETLAPKLLSYFKTRTVSGEEAVVLYYFLVKVVACPQCYETIDLFRKRIFSENAVHAKDPSARSVCPVCGGIASTRYDAEHVLCPQCSQSHNPQEGATSGPIVRCGSCRSSFRLVERMKSLREPLGFRRYAKMILTHDGQKRYKALNEFDRELERQVADEYADIANTFPRVAIEPGYNTNQMLKHNYRFWHQSFSDRQLVCISHMVKAIRAVEDPNLKVLFACLFSGVLEFNNLFTSFKGEGTGAVRHMFAHHILKPEVMPLEANIWGTSKSSGAFAGLFRSRVERALAYKANPSELRVNSSKATTIGGINHPLEVGVAQSFADFVSQTGNIYLSYGDSDLPDKSVDLVVTDPPFFDNVHYSQLADFSIIRYNRCLISRLRTPHDARAKYKTQTLSVSRRSLHQFSPNVPVSSETLVSSYSPIIIRDMKAGLLCIRPSDTLASSACRRTQSRRRCQLRCLYTSQNRRYISTSYSYAGVMARPPLRHRATTPFASPWLPRKRKYWPSQKWGLKYLLVTPK